MTQFPAFPKITVEYEDGAYEVLQASEVILRRMNGDRKDLAVLSDILALLRNLSRDEALRVLSFAKDVTVEREP